MNHTFRTYEEIKRVSTLIKIIDDMNPPKFAYDKRYLFVGCGSSYNAGLIFSEILKQMGINAQSLSAGEIMINDKKEQISKNYDTVVFLSRTGTTTETIMAAETLKGKVKSVAITCEKDTPLSALCDMSYELDFAHEESVVMTASFSAILRLFLNGIKKFQLNAEDYLEKYESLIQDELVNVKSHFVFLGYGERYYVSKESALKVEELSLDHAEFYETLEYRHGPIALLSEKTHVVIFSQHQVANPFEVELQKDIESRGGSVHILTSLSDKPKFEVQFLPLYSQLLGYKRAVIKGLNPDKPNGLSKSVILKTEQ